MSDLLEQYSKVVGEEAISHLRQLASKLKGMKVVHVNSTREGGGVAEILHRLVPMQLELGFEARWEIVSGGADFYDCTKSMHNALQGNPVSIPDRLLKNFEDTNQANAEKLRPVLHDADIVFIHDPQPAPLIRFIPDHKGKWIWRCHIDASQPYRPVWNYLRRFVIRYDSSVFSLAEFSQALPHPQYLIPPSIDPLSVKNMELGEEEVRSVCIEHGIDPDRPLIVQVSRFDRFKDPLGVIQAFKLARKFMPSLQLVLVGGTATDDPEGEAVLAEVRFAATEPDIHVLLLPPDAHRAVNALQRAADIIIQKSIKEGFGLTVTEGMWKGKPVIGGNTGGIRLQVIDHHTGYLVTTPEGAALRIRYLLQNRNMMHEMGRKAREFVKDNFLLTRQLREHLTLMVALTHGAEDRIDLD
ncbi:MAG TPA: glycosyltransferase [Nitrospirota bacterium]|jgi:trehalose synthase